LPQQLSGLKRSFSSMSSPYFPALEGEGWTENTGSTGDK